MSKIKQSPKMPPEKRREQLLKAARDLFYKKGYRETTTEEIARRARLTKGALYYHFKNKEDLLYELIVDISHQRRERLRRLVSDNVSPAKALGVILADEDEWFRHNWNYHIDIWLQAMKLPRIRKLMNRQLELFTDIFIEKINPCYGTKKQRRELALLTLSLFHGLYIRKILGPGLVDISAQTKLFETLLAKNYRDQRTKKRKK